MSKRLTYRGLINKNKALQSELAALKSSVPIGDATLSDLYAKVFQSSVNAIAVIKFDTGEVINVNHSFCELFGYQNDELIGKTVNELELWQQPTEHSQVLSLLECKKSVLLESLNFKGSKKLLTGITVRAELLCSDNQDIVVYEFINKPLEQLCKKQIDKLVSELEIQRQLFAHSPMVMIKWQSAPGWPVLYVSESIRQFGYEPEEFTSGKLLFESIIYSDDLPRLRAELREIFTLKKNYYQLRYRIKNKFGDLRWITDYTLLIKDKTGQNESIGYLLDSTDFVDNQVKIKQNELLLRNAQEAANIIVWAYDLKSRKVEFIYKKEEVFGYYFDQLTKDPLKIYDYLHPEDVNAAKAILYEAIEKKQSFRFETRFVGSGDLNLSLLVQGDVACDKNDEAAAIYAVLVDISQLKKIEEQLKKSNQRYESLLKAMPDVMLRLDTGGQIIDFQSNDNSCRLIQQCKPCIGAHVSTVVGRVIGDKVIEAIKQNTVVDKNYSFEFQGDKKEKTEYFEARLVRGSNQDYALIIRNTTKRMTLQKALASSESQYQRLYEKAPIGIFRSDSDGKMLACNREMAFILGYDDTKDINFEDNLLARKLYVKKERRNDLLGLLRENIQVEQFVFKATKRDGAKIWLSINARIADWTDRNHFTIEGFATDVSEMKRSEYQLIEAKEKAEESDKLKTAFLANISHEIRTPMNGIIGFSDLLDNFGSDETKRRFYINTIKNNTNRLLCVINDLLDISKIDAGQVEMSYNDVDLDRVVNSLYETYNLAAREKGLLLHIDDELFNSQITMRTDESKLMQILNNMLGNAIKYTDTGFVSFHYKLIGRTIRFVVEDSGVGISPKNQAAVFERFMQATSGTNRGGTGLGLAISKAWAEYLGGQIRFESEEKRGSSFFLELPVSYKEISEDTLTEKDMENLDWHNKHVLIAEDEEINYLFLYEVVSETKCKVTHARNGQEAIDKCMADSTIDIVLMDIKMPVINGLEATRRIKNKRPDLPIIAQTAYAISGDKEKTLAGGCDDYISKPISKKELFTLMHKYL